jgi:hypothetical protein
MNYRNTPPPPQRANADPCKISIGPMRSIFMYVLELEAQKDDAGNAKVDSQKTCKSAFLIPKHEPFVDKLYDAIYAATDLKFNQSVDPFTTRNFKNPLKDGDELAADPQFKYGEYTAGHWLLNSKSYQLPRVVDETCTPFEDWQEREAVCKSGFWFVASFFFKAYEADIPEQRMKVKGLHCYLNNLMFIREDEIISGFQSDPETDFAEFAKPAGGAPARGQSRGMQQQAPGRGQPPRGYPTGQRAPQNTGRRAAPPPVDVYDDDIPY